MTLILVYSFSKYTFILKIQKCSSISVVMLYLAHPLGPECEGPEGLSSNTAKPPPPPPPLPPKPPTLLLPDAPPNAPKAPLVDDDEVAEEEDKDDDEVVGRIGPKPGVIAGVAVGLERTDCRRAFIDEEEEEEEEEEVVGAEALVERTEADRMEEVCVDGKGATRAEEEEKDDDDDDEEEDEEEDVDVEVDDEAAPGARAARRCCRRYAFASSTVMALCVEDVEVEEEEP